jgi:putative membrane protein
VSFHPSVVIGLALLGGLYLYLGGRAASRRRQGAFAGALFVLLVALNGPIHELSDHSLFSVHMGQHLLLTLLFPPLFLAGLTEGIVAPLLRPAPLRWLARRLTHPIVAAGLFTAVLAFWHTPVFYEAAMRNHDLHIVQHLVFLGSAVLLWWPILSPVAALPRLPYLGQVIYLFLIGIPMSVVGALITLSDRLLYPFYATAPRVTSLSPHADQQLGGLLMWVPGGFAFWIAMTVIWFLGSAREERDEPEPVVPLDVSR